MADHMLAVLQYSPPHPHLSHTPCPGAFPFTEFEYSKSHQDDTHEKHLIKGDFPGVNTPNRGLSGRGVHPGPKWREGDQGWGPGPAASSVSLCVESFWLQRVYLDPETVDLECERVM